ncbi:AAA family ATPase [Denitratisoma oestradiolicum]|nr:bifunctional aminoglycoside phosphotransferase/ATP-binding protein [Denitratisoma oestradiolicum]TWO81037.1 hypothetical protein CBW56_06950 [Denitratisoma oestradiolicum]
MSLPPLIAALLNPARYPGPVERVDLVETHASWLLLAGERAYKIKKPVTLPFLDYGNLEKRQACCEAELRLNRRFAPDLYLEVARLTGSISDPVWNGTGPVIEHAVVMRRFAEEGRLDHVCDRGELTYQHISGLASAMAGFHDLAAAAAPDSPHGTPVRVAADSLENFDELRHLLAPHDEPMLSALEHWTHDELHRREDDFTRRKTRGRVRECHGDLHLGNLVLLGEQVLPFDCIEFNEGFRWIDVASEIAFTYVDLIDHGQPGLACWFINEWLAHSGDFDALTVLRFYAVYRSMVRAKVAALRAAQSDGNLAAAQGYLALAARLSTPAAPTLTITFGLSGSGKSRASRQRLLTDPAAATVRLRSDVERKRLFGLGALDRSGSALDSGLYDAQAHERTYRRLAELARQVLGQGWSVIVDAAFLKRRERDEFHALSETCTVPFAILAPSAPVEVLRQRVAARARKGRDASEATLEVLERQLVSHEPLEADELPWVSDPT